MADASKTQRLLAAKKKVKEYQKGKKTKSDFNRDIKTPAESLTNSTHSSLNEVQNIDETEVSNPNIHSVSPLQQYFQDVNSTVFDDLNKSKDDNFYTFDLVTYNSNDTGKVTEVYIKEENHEIMDKSDSITQPIATSPDMLAIETLDVSSTNDKFNTISTENAQKNIISDDVNGSPNLNNLIYANDENVNNVKENMQSLKQLSTQIIQMIDDNSAPNLTVKSSPKSKSIEDDSLQVEQEKNKKLLEEIHVYKNRISTLENESQSDEKRNLDAKQLLDQIQCREQTINILVSEKSELVNLLSQNETALKQSKTDCEEFSARLKTSRSRVANLEKELNVHRAEKQDKKFLEQNTDYQKIVTECESLRNQKEETAQDVSELQEKLNASTTENLKSRREIQELNSQLSLLNIKIQQLTSGVDPHQFNGHIEGLSQQINLYEKQVIDLNNIIKTLTIEKEQINIQYQQYVQQLNSQLTTFIQKFEEKSQENETLVAREQQLTKQMSELEKLLQKLQNDQQVVITNKNSNGVKKELEETLSSLQIVQEEKGILEENYQLVISERDDAFKDLELRKEEVKELEEEINRLQSNQPDNAKLLASIESDKVAASRAVTQNNELKKQLEEMQQAFIQMSNSKLELTELLNEHKYKNKELNDKLNQFESQVHTLSEAIEIKDREMVALRESGQELNKYMMQQNQLEDRLRHYEAHDHSTHALQHELQESYKKIQNFRSENETLKFHLKNAENKNKEFEIVRATLAGDHSEDKTILLSRIENLEKQNKEMEITLQQQEQYNQQQLQLEIQQLQQQLLQQYQQQQLPQQLEDLNVDDSEYKIGITPVLLSTETDNLQKVDAVDIETQSENLDNSGNLSQDIAMKQLETKFTRTMQEIANLEDEKQRLEHLVMQLQDETETIGEYVTLYQHQRGILNQRALERDEQMRQLTVDREQMKMKVDQLNELVKMLMSEKGTISPEMFDQHILSKTQLCEEHAKTHEDSTLLPPISENGVNNNNNKTAERIIELLGEIKKSNLVQPTAETAETFHPCPWCSGQLITV